jgi:ppGpp synthetase/RelA/SpoT-type nucleotidyltranferase
MQSPKLDESSPATGLIDRYKSRQALHAQFAQRLEALLVELLKESKIRTHAVTSRAKDPESLRAKLKRKSYKTLAEITDLTGIRIVVYFQDDIDRVLDVLRSEFEIDYTNSVDKRERTNQSEFGYRSFHYIISLGTHRAQLREYRPFAEMKAEVQVRSILDHAWAEIQHGALGYKAETPVPKRTQRHLAKAAALLETVDDLFMEAKKAALQTVAGLSKLRSVGLAELIPTVEFDIPSELLCQTQKQYDSITLSLSTNITNSIDSEHMLRGVTLASPSFSTADPFRGKRLGQNSVLFRNSMPRVLFPTQRSVRFVCSGLRVDAASVGIGPGESAAPVICWVAAFSSDGVSHSTELAAIEAAVVFDTYRFSVEPAAAFPMNTDEPNGIIPIGTASFHELFPSAFRSQEQESAGPLGPANSGTRLVVRLSNLPEGLKLFADIRTKGIEACMTRCDSNGAGTFDPVAPDEFLHGHEVASITSRGGAAQLVWDVRQREQGAKTAQITFWARKSEKSTYSIVLTGGLGPTSTLNTGQCYYIAPVPRFINDPQAAVLAVPSA